MERIEIFEQVIIICQKVFDNHSYAFTENTKPDDLPRWDSLNHAILINEIEKHFNIKFDIMDVMNFESLGDITAGVEQKLAR